MHRKAYPRNPDNIHPRGRLEDTRRTALSCCTSTLGEWITLAAEPYTIVPASAVNFSPAKVVEKTEDSETTKGVSAPAKATLWNLKDTTGLDLPSTSAKSMYRLSDSLLSPYMLLPAVDSHLVAELDVPELLAAAKQHVIGSLTIENVVEEISSPFSRTHPAIRKEQFAYLQKNWVHSPCLKHELPLTKFWF